MNNLRRIDSVPSRSVLGSCLQRISPGLALIDSPHLNIKHPHGEASRSGGVLRGLQRWNQYIRKEKMERKKRRKKERMEIHMQVRVMNASLMCSEMAPIKTRGLHRPMDAYFPRRLCGYKSVAFGTTSTKRCLKGEKVFLGGIFIT